MDDDLTPDGKSALTLNLEDPDVAERYRLAERHAQQIRHALALGMRQRAQQLVIDADHQLRRLSTGDRLEKTPIAQLEGVDDATINLLEEGADVITVGDLLQVTSARLIAIPNFGEGRLMALFGALLRHTVRTCTAYEARLDTLEREAPLAKEAKQR